MNKTTSEEADPEAVLLLSVADAAVLLGLSKWTMYELMHAGHLPSIKVGRRRLIARADLRAYVAKLRRESQDRHGL